MENKQKNRILCYGDSNTWAQIPGGGQYEPHESWAGILQNKLKDTHQVLIEGLPGRTTNIDNPIEPYRNGYNYLVPCLLSHSDLDIIIFFLGSTECSTDFDRDASDIADGLEDILSITNELTPDTHLVIIAPPYKQKVADTLIGYANQDKDIKTSKELPKKFQTLAEKYDATFIDSNKYIQTSKIDGEHLDKEAHKKLAEIILEII